MLYKVIDKKVRMHILEDFVGELREVKKDGFVSNEYDVKGHFFVVWV